MTDATMKSTAEKTHVTFRVEEKLHAKASQMASPQGGLSKIIRNGFENFLTGKVVFEPEKFQIEASTSSPKDKRVSMKLDENIYANLQRKAVRFGDVSGLVRSIFKSYCSAAG